MAVAVRCRRSFLRGRRAAAADHRLPLQPGLRGCFFSPAPAWRNAPTQFAPMHRRGEHRGEGDIFRNPDLARTYRAIAEGGREVFYEGPIARTIDAYFKRIGGWLSREDLRDQHAEWVEPLVSSYRGVDVYAMGENTQGLATLQMLNILEHFDLAAMGFQSAAAIHVQAEAKRLAFADRARFYADPHFAEIPIEWLASKAYGAERAELIRPDRILEHMTPGEPPCAGDTTYLSVADSSGMMVSMIQSNYRGMGSGLVADGLGFMFQDRGQLFSLEDGHPNLYQPGKRPFHTIIPGFAARGGRPVDELRCHGRRHAAAGPNADPAQPRRFRPGRAGGRRQSPLAPRRLPAAHGRGRGRARRTRQAASGERRSGALAARARRPGLGHRPLGRRLRAVPMHRASHERRASACMPPQAKCAPMESRSPTSSPKWAGLC